MRWKMALLLELLLLLLVHLSGCEISSLPSTEAGMRWCCISQAEMLKCHDLANAISREASPSVSMLCVLGDNVTNCVLMISRDDADVITLGEEEIYKAATEHGLVPVVAEDYGKHEEGLSYYSVALIRSNLSMDVSLLSLEGRRSCHPAAGSTVGWKAPVGRLMLSKLIKWTNCNPYHSTAEYFEKSCVPGALSKQFNQDNRNPANLCAVCTNQDTCPMNASERYYGLSGAYHCLIEGAGDVAFVDYLTVFEFTGADNDLNPGLDFKLLCPGGERQDVGNFKRCNLARIPSRVVMSRPGNKLENFKRMLLLLDERFRNNTSLFKMFNSSAYGDKDLLFKDSTMKIIDVKGKNSSRRWLGEEYFGILQTLDTCPTIAARVARSLSPEFRALGVGIILFIKISLILFT